MGAIREAADAAEAMKPLAGRYVYFFFVSPSACSMLRCSPPPFWPLLNCLHGLRRTGACSPVWTAVSKTRRSSTGSIRFSSPAEPIAVLFVPNGKLISMVILSQVLNGVLLPLVIVFMLLLINRKDLMGEYVNSRWFNAVAWLTSRGGYCVVTGHDVYRRRRLVAVIR